MPNWNADRSRLARLDRLEHAAQPDPEALAAERRADEARAVYYALLCALAERWGYPARWADERMAQAAGVSPAERRQHLYYDILMHAVATQGHWDAEDGHPERWATR